MQLWGDYIRTRVAIDKLAQIINLPAEQHSDGLHPQLTGKIQFQNVDFRYQPDLPLIINQYNLSIKAGEMIGIVGASGSGKSTLARLLLRLYTPEKGGILLDDIPLYQINIASLRQQIGIVLQENFLFNQSVFNNIAQSKPDATLDEVITAAKLAGAHDFILKMPSGYDSLIAEVKILNKDIGFIRPGQNVTVKVDAFPYTRYGTIEDEVLSISRDSAQDEQLELIFPAQISLKQNNLMVDGHSIDITPGMSIVAEIKTDKRRVIDYLLSPIREYLSESMREK